LNSTDGERLNEIAELLRELLKWSKLERMPRLRTVLEQNLRNNDEMLAFELSDGTRSSRDVAALLGVDHKKVLRYWEKWNKLGIVEKSGHHQGRYEHVCALEEVGMEPPQLERQESQGRDNEKGGENVGRE